MDFVQAAKANDPHTSLRYRLHKLLTVKQPARPLSIIHASEVTKPEFCARRTAIMLATGVKPADETITTSLAVTFQLGRVLQDSIVQWAADCGIAISSWKCLGCGKLHTFQQRPTKCTCKTTRFDPIELRFTSPVSGISGGFDMIVNLGEPKLRLVEIKTIDKDQFKTLAAPLAEHKVRTNLYLRIVAETDNPLSDRINTDEALVLYVSKGGYGTQDQQLTLDWKMPDKFSPFKEYRVSRDDTMTDDIVAPAKSLHEWRLGKAGMPMLTCGSQYVDRAKYCKVCQACFSDQFPPGMQNPDPVGVV